MEISKQVKRVASYFGYYSRNPIKKNVQFNTTILINLTLNLLLTTNNILYLINNWNDFCSRYNSLKSMSVMCCFDIYIILFMINWGKIQSILDLLENQDNDQFPFDNRLVTNRRKELISKGIKEQERRNRYIHHTCLYFFGGLSVIPFFTSLVKLYKHSNQIKVVDLQFSHPFYTPNVLNEHLYFYFIIMFLQTLHNLFSCGYAYVSHITVINAMTKVITNIRLLCLTLKEMDEHVSTCSQKCKDDKNNEVYQKHLQHYLKFIVQNQQAIYRETITIKDGVEAFVFVFNTGISIFVCMVVYFTVQNSELIFKIIEFILCGLTVSIIYLYDLIGERLTTEGENLRMALYESSWIRKPIWFKKSLLLCMVRSTTPIQIKPLGLLVLSLNSFALMINATYSYYNLLNSANKA